jgi:hypothetical protein
MVCVDTMMIHVGLAEWDPVHIKHRRETMVDVGDRHTYYLSHIWVHTMGMFNMRGGLDYNTLYIYIHYIYIYYNIYSLSMGT